MILAVSVASPGLQGRPPRWRCGRRRRPVEYERAPASAPRNPRRRRWTRERLRERSTAAGRLRLRGRGCAAVERGTPAAAAAAPPVAVPDPAVASARRGTSSPRPRASTRRRPSLQPLALVEVALGEQGEAVAGERLGGHFVILDVQGEGGLAVRADQQRIGVVDVDLGAE